MDKKEKGEFIRGVQSLHVPSRTPEDNLIIDMQNKAAESGTVCDSAEYIKLLSRKVKKMLNKF